MNQYEKLYDQDDYYWSKKPSKMCCKVLDLLPPEKPLKLLDIGCGEGRNAVFFARNGYHVSAFDLAESGVRKTKEYANEVGVEIDAFVTNLLEYRLSEKFDILFSAGVLHCIPSNLREEIFDNYKQHTNPDGIHVFGVFVKKPFIEKAPDSEKIVQKWISGELFSHYRDWKIEYCTEEIFDCMSGGIPHKHAINRIFARNVV